MTLEAAAAAGFKIKRGVVTDGRPFAAKLNRKLDIFAAILRAQQAEQMAVCYEKLLKEAAGHVQDAQRYRALRALACMPSDQGEQFADIMARVPAEPTPQLIDEVVDACRAKDSTL